MRAFWHKRPMTSIDDGAHDGDGTRVHDGDGSHDGDGVDRVRNITRLALRSVLTDIRGGRRPYPILTPELRKACEVARAQGLHAEQLIVIVKDSWRRLEGIPSLDHFEAEAMLQGVVTECIEEFYRPGPQQ